MDNIIDYMTNRKWAENVKGDRILYLYQLAKSSSQSADIAGKIGAMLIYNQVIEQVCIDCRSECQLY